VGVRWYSRPPIERHARAATGSTASCQSVELCDRASSPVGVAGLTWVAGSSSSTWITECERPP
jgi:hypothetical protein